MSIFPWNLKHISSLFREIFSERNFDGNPSTEQFRKQQRYKKRARYALGTKNLVHGQGKKMSRCSEARKEAEKSRETMP